MPDWQAFLASLALTPNVTEACRRAGVARSVAYRHRAEDAAFAAAWDDAVDQAVDELVGECYRRAFEGYEDPVFYQGEEVGRVRRHSDTLAIFLLKAHRRRVYGDKVEQQHEGGLTIRVEYADADDADSDLAPPPPGPAVDPEGGAAV